MMWELEGENWTKKSKLQKQLAIKDALTRAGDNIKSAANDIAQIAVLASEAGIDLTMPATNGMTATEQEEHANLKSTVQDLYEDGELFCRMGQTLTGSVMAILNKIKPTAEKSGQKETPMFQGLKLAAKRG